MASLYYAATYMRIPPVGHPPKLKKFSFGGNDMRNIALQKFSVNIFLTCSWAEHVEVYDRPCRAEKGGVSA